MILNDFRDLALSSIERVEPASRRELAAVIDHALFAIEVNPKSARSAVAELRDRLTNIVRLNGRHDPSSAWLPVLPYISNLHALHHREDEVTTKSLQDALEELQTALTP